MQYGLRIIYDKNTGKVLNGSFGEMSGELQEGLRPLEIDFLDLPYGDTSLALADQYHVDILNKVVIVDSAITPKEV